jgi:prevent-host-death family protein
LAKVSYDHAVRVNVGQAKTDLSKLLARVEAGEDVEIARDGVPVARLVAIEPSSRPGQRFLAARGSLAGKIEIASDFEFSDEEIDTMLDDGA